jgi:hypothetical protein
MRTRVEPVKDSVGASGKGNGPRTSARYDPCGGTLLRDHRYRWLRPVDRRRNRKHRAMAAFLYYEVMEILSGPRKAGAISLASIFARSRLIMTRAAATCFSRGAGAPQSIGLMCSMSAGKRGAVWRNQMLPHCLWHAAEFAAAWSVESRSNSLKSQRLRCWHGICNVIPTDARNSIGSQHDVENSKGCPGMATARSVYRRVCLRGGLSLLSSIALAVPVCMERIP